jgi:hypothetical protein
MGFWSLFQILICIDETEARGVGGAGGGEGRAKPGLV